MPPLKSITELEPTKKAFSLAQEFRDFAFKANVIDLAVGVIIGAAFSKLIDSLVKHVLMPLISLVVPSDQGYAAWAITVGNKQVPYGQFLAEIVNFLIIALVLYLFVVKFLGWLRRMRQEQEAAAPPPLTKETQLLTEIRDLLRQGRLEPKAEG